MSDSSSPWRPGPPPFSGTDPTSQQCGRRGAPVRESREQSPHAARVYFAGSLGSALEVGCELVCYGVTCRSKVTESASIQQWGDLSDLSLLQTRMTFTQVILATGDSQACYSHVDEELDRRALCHAFDVVEATGNVLCCFYCSVWSHFVCIAHQHQVRQTQDFTQYPWLVSMISFMMQLPRPPINFCVGICDNEFHL